MTEFTLYAADTRTGRIAYELPAVSCSWSSAINTDGSLQATLIIEDVLGALSDQDERDPRTVLYGLLTGGWRYCLVLAYGNSVVWAGPYKKASRSSDNAAQISLVCADILAVLNKRTAADQTYTATSLPAIMKQVIDAATTGSGNELPLTSTAATNPIGEESRTYFGYDLKSYAQIIADLIASDNGPDLRFDPVLALGPDGNYVSWDVQIGTPYVGQLSTPWAWDAGVTARLAWDIDFSAMAFKLYATGAGSGIDKVIRQTTDLTLVNLGFPMLEDVDSGHTSETEPIILDSYAAAGLAARSRPVEQWTIQVQASGDPPLGSYRAGDAMLLDVRGDALHQDGTYRRRITSISGDLSDDVTLAIAEPPAGF